MPKKKLYIGVKAGYVWEAFESEQPPTWETYGGKYSAVIGPFRTNAGRNWALLYGKGNPHFQTVNDAERLARQDKAKTLWKCDCTANCGGEIIKKNDKLYFKSAVQPTPVVIEYIDDLGYINGEWSISAYITAKLKAELPHEI